jgi:heme-degrading monooxygenase HmoA
MIIRVFRARPRPGAVDELTRFAEEVSIPFVDSQPGLVARYVGRGAGATGDELLMITVWKDLDAMKNMTGEDWEDPVIPDERLEPLIEESFLQHYESIGRDPLAR